MIQRVLITSVALFLSGCFDGWEKSPSVEVGIPYEQEAGPAQYRAPNPAAFDLKIYRVDDQGQETPVVGVIEAEEGERVEIFVRGMNFDPSRVEIHEILFKPNKDMEGVISDYNPSRGELRLEWQVPERYVLSHRQNYRVTDTLSFQLRAYKRLSTPGGEHVRQALEVEREFKLMVYRRFAGLEPDILGIEPKPLQLVENEVLNFNVIVKDPGSASYSDPLYQPQVRVVQTNLPGTAPARDGSFYVLRRSSEPPFQVDPADPQVWAIPMIIDLRGKEVTDAAHLLYFGLQAVSRISPDLNVLCDVGEAECHLKEISSLVYDFNFRAFTSVGVPESSLQDEVQIEAGETSKIQWQIFDPRGEGRVQAAMDTCPAGATCSCVIIPRVDYTTCHMAWNPPCNQTRTLHRVAVRGQNYSKSGPDRTSPIRTYGQQVRVIASTSGKCGGN